MQTFRAYVGVDIRVSIVCVRVSEVMRKVCASEWRVQNVFIVCCAALCRYTVDIAIPRPVCGPVHETETGHVQALEIDNNVWFYVCSFLFVF